MQHFSYLAEIFVVGGIVSALIIAADLHSCRQPMRIMNSVWILTGLWASVIGLWAYFTFGRPRHCDLEEHNGGRKTGTKPETGAETRAEAETGARAAEAGADGMRKMSSTAGMENMGETAGMPGMAMPGMRLSLIHI